MEGPALFDPVTNLVIPRDNACRFHAFPSAEAADCLKGAWLFFMGGSQANIIALRTVGFFKGQGQDTAYAPPKQDQARGVRNVDVIFTDALATTTEYTHVSSTNNMTEEKQANQVDTFLQDANANFHRRRKSGTVVDLRITLLQDRYGLAAGGLAKSLHSVMRGVPGITKAYFVLGPVGAWYATCTPKAIQSWSCNVNALRRLPEADILIAYRNLWVHTLSTMVRAQVAGTLAGTLVLPFREPYRQQYALAVAETTTLLSAELKGRVSPDEVAKMLPLQQGEYYETWFLSPLAWSLVPQPYKEQYEGHPSGVTAHWSLLFVLAAFCPNTRQECPLNPGFPQLCWTSNMRAAARKMAFPPWDGTEGGFFASLKIKGCRVKGSVQPISRPAYRLGSAVGRAVGPFVFSAEGSARQDQVSVTNGPPASAQPTSPFKLVRMWLLTLGSACLIALLMWRDASRGAADAVAKPAEGVVDSNQRQRQGQGQSIRIDSLVFARYIASLHVVAGHLLGRGYLMTTLSFMQPLLGWGFSWVPFFFMLSGFVLAYVKLMRISPYLRPAEQQELLAKGLESPLLFVYKRSINVYPMYLLGLVGSAALSWFLHTPLPAASNWVTVLSQALLLQAWLPAVEHTLQAHCWFISCEVAYWALFPVMLRALLSFSFTGLLSLLLLLPPVLLSVMLWILPALMGLPAGWEHMGDSGGYVSTLKFHPVCYAHVFFLGMVSACLFRFYRHDQQAGDGISPDTSPAAIMASFMPPPLVKRACYFLISRGASIGYLLLLLLLFLPELHPPAILPKLSFRLGLLCPLHGLILLGLAGSTDPLASAFAWWPLQCLGQWSYAQFVLQFIAFRLYFGVLLPDQSQQHWAAKWGFFAFLTALAAMGYSLVQAPLREERRYNKFLWFGGGGVLIWMLLAACPPPSSFLRSPFSLTSGSSSRKSTPAYVHLEMGCFDARLNLTLGGGAKTSVRRQGGAIINPSALHLGGGRLLLVARWHRVDEVKNASSTAYIWRSVLVAATLDRSWQQVTDFVELRPSLPRVLGKDKRPGGQQSSSSQQQQWQPCHKPGVYFAANNSRVTVLSTGPQDPRLFLHQGRYPMLSFFSMNPNLKLKPAPSANKDSATDIPPSAICRGDMHGQVFLTQIAAPGAADADAAVSSPPQARPKSSQSLAPGPGLVSRPSRDKNVSASLTALSASLSASAGAAASLGAVYSLPLMESLPNRPYPVVDYKAARLGVTAPKATKEAHEALLGSLGLVEKNWLFFEHSGRTLFVYRVYPHVVVEVCFKISPRCPQDLVLFTGKARLLGDIVRDYGAVDDGLIAHGGAPPMRYKAENGTVLFLASFHTQPLYRHYLYLFEPKNFDIVAVSAPLPLVEHPSAPGVTFVSSIVPGGAGGYGVLYGSGDRESRVLVLTEEAMHALFAHANL